MSSWPCISTASQTSSILNGYAEQQVPGPTESEILTRNEFTALPRSKDGFAPSTGPKDHVARKPLSPNNSASGNFVIIMGGFVAGIVLAIGHHMFLTFLNGRDIDEYPQYWIKNANNAFSAVFSLCIAFVSTSALTQMKWNVARSKPLSIRSIDNLFALPSPVALFTTVTLNRLQSLRLFPFPILGAIFIQSLSFVSIFAPNALTVARSAEISRDLIVPTLDLSTGFSTSISTDATGNTSVSQLWTTALTSIMLQPPILNWKIPSGCGDTCKFDLEYEGPGLQCTDTSLEPRPYAQESDWPLVYNATSTLYSTPRNDSSYLGILDSYDLRISYITTDTDGYSIGRQGGSVYCVFRDAAYKASFQVENNTMEVNNAIQSYGDILGTAKSDESDSLCSPCLINDANTRAICEVFASAFTGQIRHGVNLSEAAGLTGTTGGINEAVIDLLFSHVYYSIDTKFRLAVSNLSESLVSLFSNLTLGFIPYRTDATTVQAEIWDGSYAWSYAVWVLWAIYLPTLLLASLVILNGLLSIQSNKQGMDEKFSSFVLTTRNTELDEVCMDAEHFAEFQRFRLLYHGEKGTFSVVSIPSEGVVGKM